MIVDSDEVNEECRFIYSQRKYESINYYLFYLYFFYYRKIKVLWKIYILFNIYNKFLLKLKKCQNFNIDFNGWKIFNRK